MFPRTPFKHGRTGHAARDDDAGHFIGEIAAESFALHVLREAEQVLHFRPADDLRPLAGEKLKISRELQTGTTDIRDIDAHVPLRGGNDGLQLQRFGKFSRRNHLQSSV